MTHAQREEFIRLFDELQQALPEMRLGQLVSNLATIARGPSLEAVWDVEDAELVEAARRQLQMLESRVN